MIYLTFMRVSTNLRHLLRRRHITLARVNMLTGHSVKHIKKSIKYKKLKFQIISYNPIKSQNLIKAPFSLLKPEKNFTFYSQSRAPPARLGRRNLHTAAPSVRDNRAPAFGRSGTTPPTKKKKP